MPGKHSLLPCLRLFPLASCTPAAATPCLLASPNPRQTTSQNFSHCLPSSQAAFDAAVAVLEADGGVAAPTDSPQLDGRWRLMFTTRPGTASPIQRTFTAVDSFKSELGRSVQWLFV